MSLVRCTLPPVAKAWFINTNHRSASRTPLRTTRLRVVSHPAQECTPSLRQYDARLLTRSFHVWSPKLAVHPYRGAVLRSAFSRTSFPSPTLAMTLRSSRATRLSQQYVPLFLIYVLTYIYTSQGKFEDHVLQKRHCETCTGERSDLHETFRHSRNRNIRHIGILLSWRNPISLPRVPTHR